MEKMFPNRAILEIKKIVRKENCLFRKKNLKAKMGRKYIEEP